MNGICATYTELFSNIFKRILLLLGKLAGYKGFAVLVATVLLKSGYIGEGAWATVVVSALCGMIVPKAFTAAGGVGGSFAGQGFTEEEDYEKKYFDESAGGFYSSSRRKSTAGRSEASEAGKKRIREAFERAAMRRDTEPRAGE